MWFKVYETNNYRGVSEELHEKCVKKFIHKSEFVKELFREYYKVSIFLETPQELIAFINDCGSEVVINKNKEIEIYNDYRE